LLGTVNDRGDFVFQVGKPDVLVTLAVPTPQPTSDAAHAWAAAKDTTSPAVLDSFIRRYGDSFYADLARARLEELKKSQVGVIAPPASTASAETAAPPSTSGPAPVSTPVADQPPAQASVSPAGRSGSRGCNDIAACTALIDSGHFTGEELANLYFERGFEYRNNNNYK
jgi:hypothetical protein